MDKIEALAAKTSTVLAKRVGHVLLVTINRPEVRNAVDPKTSYDIDAILTAAEQDDGIGAMVVTGAGDKSFCSGMDLKDAAEHGPGRGLIEGRGFCGITERVFTKPLLAAVNGAAVAGGLEISLACDIIVASDKAVFGLPEIKRGMVAFAGGVQRLAQVAPRSIAMEIILTGRYLPAERLREVGLVSRVVPQADVVSTTLAIADDIVAASPYILRNAKKLFNASRDLPLPMALAFGNAMGVELLQSAATKEGVTAYAEHRDARFSKE
jgi:enoyl-CoA hydratase/carnithine racemase